MKNKVFSMVLAVLFIFGLLFVGCDALNDMINNNDDDKTGDTTKDNKDGNNGNNGDNTNMTKLEGTWRNPGGNHPAFTFADNTYKHFNVFDSLNEGTFTFTDKTITFTPTDGESWTQAYTLNGNTLTLTNDGIHNYGPYVKNYELEKTKFEGVWKNNNNNFNVILTFRYNCYNVFWGGDNGEPDYLDTGHFTFDNTSITFTDWSQVQKWKNDTYTLTDDTTLFLSQPPTTGDYHYFHGTYTKQSE